MLFKIPFRNIKRSLRDYAIYFFTLIIGVSIFYVFNAIGGQAAMMRVSERRDDIAELLQSMLSGVSVFVAIVLALLIVYASRFLMKRRNKEFAIYMMLGMSKGAISGILLSETLIIGFFSLVVGLVLGIGISQLMSALVAGLFEADMTAYKLTVSRDSLFMTCLFFAIMYILVLLFNGAAVTRMKLIDLIQSGRKSENVKSRTPFLCIGIFIISAAALGFAYYQVGWNYAELNQKNIMIYIALGAVSTFLIFWSISGLVLRIVSLNKRSYYHGLNAFTFRQIISRINTMVFSMTIICLMLFVTICTLAASFSVRNSMNANLQLLCPADAEIHFSRLEEDGTKEYENLADMYERYGYEITDGYSEYVHFAMYSDPVFTFADSLGTHLDTLKAQYQFLDYESPEEIIRLSDYNNLMRLYGRDTFELEEGQYILICDFASMKNVRNEALADSSIISVFGTTLAPKYNECQDGFISISAQHINPGVFIVPDSVVPDYAAKADYFIGNYAAEGKEKIAQMEAVQRERYKEVIRLWGEDHQMITYSDSINTRLNIYEAAVGLGAIITFLGLYIGLIFLIACGAILALKELSESIDSIPRYEILRKIGTEEGDISTSLLRQTGIFFLLPLILASIHSVFGMKFAAKVLETFGTERIWESIGLTSAILLVIYGGYFLVTYFNSRSIIRQND